MVIFNLIHLKNTILTFQHGISNEQFFKPIKRRKSMPNWPKSINRILHRRKRPKPNKNHRKLQPRKEKFNPILNARTRKFHQKSSKRRRSHPITIIKKNIQNIKKKQKNSIKKIKKTKLILWKLKLKWRKFLGIK